MNKDFDLEKEMEEVEKLYGHRLKTSKYSSGEELSKKAKERLLEIKKQKGK